MFVRPCSRRQQGSLVVLLTPAGQRAANFDLSGEHNLVAALDRRACTSAQCVIEASEWRTARRDITKYRQDIDDGVVVEGDPLRIILTQRKVLRPSAVRI